MEAAECIDQKRTDQATQKVHNLKGRAQSRKGIEAEQRT
jgi:hypothetical protein